MGLAEKLATEFTNFIFGKGPYRRQDNSGRPVTRAPQQKTQLEVTKNKNDVSHKLSITCFSCSKKFEYEVDLTNAKNTDVGEVVEFAAYCPYCGFAFKGKIQKQPEGA